MIAQSRNQMPEPIVDELYSRCKDFLNAVGSNDSKRMRKLFGTIQEFWWQRREAGDDLPKPPVPGAQARRTDDIYIDQAMQWVGAIMRELEARRRLRYG
jgi:hypothetical protein